MRKIAMRTTYLMDQEELDEVAEVAKRRLYTARKTGKNYTEFFIIMDTKKVATVKKRKNGEFVLDIETEAFDNIVEEYMFRKHKPAYIGGTDDYDAAAEEGGD